MALHLLPGELTPEAFDALHRVPVQTSWASFDANRVRHTLFGIGRRAVWETQ